MYILKLLDTCHHRCWKVIAQLQTTPILQSTFSNREICSQKGIRVYVLKRLSSQVLNQQNPIYYIEKKNKDDVNKLWKAMVIKNF